MWIKPMELALPEIAAEHPLAPEGIELYDWQFAADGLSESEPFVVVSESLPISPHFACEYEFVDTLVASQRVIGRMASDRHAGAVIWFGWDEELRKAVAWIS
jgi:hypothetical protein